MQMRMILICGANFTTQPRFCQAIFENKRKINNLTQPDFYGIIRWEAPKTILGYYNILIYQYTQMRMILIRKAPILPQNAHNVKRKRKNK